MGNKTKYSRTIVARICRYIESGLNNKQACQASGICESTLAAWRREYADFDSKIEAAREVMRAKVLAQIKAAGAKDWRAHAEFLRLAFAEYRFGNSPQVSVAIQNNMPLNDPERAGLIAKIEEARAKALADKSGATSAPKDASDAREIALEAERSLKEGAPQQPAKPLMLPLPKPKPMTIVERADDQLRRMQREGWRSADCVDVDELDG